ncbi:MAG: PD40 domain-containing protein [Candidatus Zixiibacteriota bacterium]|nr:MAG: PD40 domain-containing protein [candidate division Zixibacteria bacterium]
MKISIVLAICGMLWSNAFAQDLIQPRETHFDNMRQLTFRGENAEAYFSGDDKRLIFQSTRDEYNCDQIFVMNADGGDIRLVSNGRGRTTCAFFNPVGGNIIYASTYMADTACPPPPSMEFGYVWAVYPGYNIFSSSGHGSNLSLLIESPGYDAEAVYSPDGSMIAFTSTRDGDLEIYIMKSDGSKTWRVTSNTGYDGGAFFSPDGRKLVFRAQQFPTEEDLEEYKILLEKNLVKPSKMEICTINIDGTDRKQITDNGAANFAPYFHPSGEKIIFSSDLDNPREHNFELYLIDTDGKNLERVTYSEQFDGFPMFSYGGDKIVFASNRNNGGTRLTNIFIAGWVE